MTLTLAEAIAAYCKLRKKTKRSSARQRIYLWMQAQSDLAYRYSYTGKRLIDQVAFDKWLPTVTTGRPKTKT